MSFESQPMRVAMLVVDANDVRGSSMRRGAAPSPVVHPAIEALWEGLSERQDCRVEVLFGRNQPAQAVRPKKGSVSFREVPYQRLGGFLPGAGFLGRRKSLLRALSGSPPDLVHGQGSERESALVAVSSCAPGVLTLHGLMGEVAEMSGNRTQWHYRVAGWIEKCAVKKARGTIAISPYALRIILGMTHQCRLIPNAVREIFYELPARAQASGKPRILFVGNLTPVKRPEWFVRAVQLLWEEGLDFEARMLVMGDPQHPYYQGILRQAHGPVRGQEIEIKPNVSKVWEEMADADILFAPSTWESMGIAVCEAMAAGLCVVASRIEANIPLLGQGCGLMFPTGSFAEAYHVLRASIVDGDFRRATVERAKKRVLAYHPAKIAEQTVDYYRDILREARTAG